MRDRAELEREIASRDAFLARISEKLDELLAALPADEAHDGVRGFARELAVIAGRCEAAAPSLREHDVEVLVHGVIARLRARSPSPEVELRVSASGEMRTKLDEGHLETMLLELLSNAWKYGGGRAIDLRVEGLAETVRIEVADRGEGVAPDEVAGRRFARGARVGDRPGFGVGVWLVHELARVGGGRFELCAREGGGTRAVLTLPRVL